MFVSSRQIMPLVLQSVNIDLDLLTVNKRSTPTSLRTWGAFKNLSDPQHVIAHLLSPLFPPRWGPVWGMGWRSCGPKRTADEGPT